MMNFSFRSIHSCTCHTCRPRQGCLFVGRLEGPSCCDLFLVFVVVGGDRLIKISCPPVQAVEKEMNGRYVDVLNRWCVVLPPGVVTIDRQMSLFYCIEVFCRCCFVRESMS